VVVVAVGGGGIATMSTRWEAAAREYDEEKSNVTDAARNAPSVKDQATQAKGKAQQATSSSGNNPGAHTDR